jgi:hypothetical protein
MPLKQINKKILIKNIKNFKNIKNYKMIGLIGSIIKKRGKLNDVDLVSISDLHTHRKFREHLSNEFRKNNIKIIFFKTIMNKPKTKKNVVLVHDLHYKNIEHLLKIEWKTIINYMKENIKIIYGENLISKISKQKISKEALCKPLYKWVNKIKNYKKYKILKEHFLLYTLKDFYDYGFKVMGYKLKNILISNINWKNKLKEMRTILK